MNRSINPRMVTLARESRGLTQAELAQRMHVHQGKVSKVEAGLITVTDDTLNALCRALDYPSGFFYQLDAVHGIDTSILFHRKRQSIASRALAKIHATVNIRRMHLQRLLSAVDIEADMAFPALDIDEFAGGVVAIAKAVRAAWMLPRGPVENVTAAIEKAGGVVIRCDFETALVDAVGQWIPGFPPMFFVRGDIPGDRLRWTLAHEIGHAVMHRVVTERIEAEADTFASAFLMPADDIAPYFSGGVTTAKLATLKPLWRCSMAALLKRATDIGSIQERQARYIWMQFGKAGWRTREPAHLDVPLEEPTVLREIVDVHTGKLGFSAGDLGKLLNMSDQELKDIYAPRASGLRTVRRQA